MSQVAWHPILNRFRLNASDPQHLSEEGVIAELAQVRERLDVNSVEQGTVPAVFALSQGMLQVLKWLLVAGADPQATDTYGHSLLGFAVRRGDVQSATLLLAHGADVGTVTADPVEGMADHLSCYWQAFANDRRVAREVRDAVAKAVAAWGAAVVTLCLEHGIDLTPAWNMSFADEPVFVDGARIAIERGQWHPFFLAQCVNWFDPGLARAIVGSGRGPELRALAAAEAGAQELRTFLAALDAQEAVAATLAHAAAPGVVA